MQRYADHTFHIGEQHLRQGKPCQDYALSGVGEKLAYAIVADGCSSGGMTDIGARLVALATARAIPENIHFRDREVVVGGVDIARDSYLESYRACLQLKTSDLLATSMWAIVTDNAIVTHVTGDGVVALQYEHDLILERFDWTNNTPYYPAYRLGGEDESFRRFHEEAAQAPLTYIRESTRPGMGGVPDGSLERVPLDVAMLGIPSEWSHGEEGVYPGRLIAVGLFSDGVEQIDNVEEVDAIKSLMAFKSTGGKFAVRRMNRFLEDVRKVGKGPQDDIAMAVIHLGTTTKP